jgi:shikimate kinase
LPSSSSGRGEKNIVITGFMGTGKTTAARRVAELTGRMFVDTDEEIKRRAGKTIPRIFDEDGEFVFRAMERQLCAELAAQRGLVIATGGGMLVDEGNRSLMLASSFVVCLDAAPETIAARLEGADDRPLAKDWKALLEKRREVYTAIPTHIDTTNKRPDEVAQEIIRLWQSA